jgi:hypothetical protein
MTRITVLRDGGEDLHELGGCFRMGEFGNDVADAALDPLPAAVIKQQPTGCGRVCSRQG